MRGNHDDSLLFAHEKREAARARGHVPQDDEKYAYADELSTEDAEVSPERNPNPNPNPNLGTLILRLRP